MSFVTANPSRQPQQNLGLRAVSMVGILLFVVGALLPLLVGAQSWIAPVRWTALLAMALTGLRGQSLTRWIFFAMLLGGEIGLDRPQFAEHLRVFSEIFLRLIKVIVAPLI